MSLQKKEPEKQNPRISLFWWGIFIILMIWNIFSFWPQTVEQAQIPYSEFITQTKNQNITSVKITGNVITGAFKQALTWPPSTQPAPTPAGTPASGSQSAPYTEFKTIYPDVVGDPNLIALLETNGAQVDVAPPPNPWLEALLANGLPLFLLLAFFLWMGRRASQNQANIFGFGRTKARRYSEDREDISFKDVAGEEEAKVELQEVVDFLRHPEKYHELGAHIPRGVLLVGPPGTGKTLMARAVAGEADVPFFSISASEFVEMFVGIGASRVRDLFEQAKTSSPAIVFIDELDAVGRRRGAGLGQVNDEREQTLNQLLVEMDGFDEHHELIVMAATNRPDVLDPALLRPGRFDRQINVRLPDRLGRLGILQIHTRGLHLASDIDLDLLARVTTGLSGADLANMANEAALIAARHDHKTISLNDFEEALDKVILGGVRPLLMDAHDRRVVAIHEAGHALVAWLTPEADLVHKITIIPHGRALGVTEQLPAEDLYNYSREYLKARLAVMLGGRSAEEIMIGDFTTGAENDLVEATRLARRMVTRWGMSDLGLIAFQADEQQPFLGYELAQGRDFSEETASRIDHYVEEILAERHHYARQVIQAAVEPLNALVEALLKEETVDQDMLVQILGPRPESSIEPQPSLV